MSGIQCSTCRHFQRDPINPAEGMGRCMHEARHGYWHPGQVHRCMDHEADQKAVDTPQIRL